LARGRYRNPIDAFNGRIIADALDTFAAHALRMIVPSPLVGEDSSVGRHDALGRGFVAAKEAAPERS